MFHFFNGISLANTPWVTTFETSLPRGLGKGFWYQQGLKRLAHDSCKKIFALSECAKQIQLNSLSQIDQKIAKLIADKIEVLHPAQKLLIPNIEVKNNNPDIIHFIFIGADFFRKGGLEVLNVFDCFIPQNKNLKLTIISSLQYGDYCTKTTSKDLEFARTIISRYAQNITQYNYLENKEVLEILKNSDVALLPTWGDTYGYSVLEAQASGCPVISTDIRALPEVNNDDCGWIIKVPKDELGNAILKTPSDRTKFSKTIESQLEAIINSILKKPNDIPTKAILALDRIKKKHNPHHNAYILDQHYRNALK